MPTPSSNTPKSISSYQQKNDFSQQNKKKVMPLASNKQSLRLPKETKK